MALIEGSLRVSTANFLSFLGVCADVVSDELNQTNNCSVAVALKKSAPKPPTPPKPPSSVNLAPIIQLLLLDD